MARWIRMRWRVTSPITSYAMSSNRKAGDTWSFRTLERYCQQPLKDIVSYASATTYATLSLVSIVN